MLGEVCSVFEILCCYFAFPPLLPKYCCNKRNGIDVKASPLLLSDLDPSTDAVIMSEECGICGEAP